MSDALATLVVDGREVSRSTRPRGVRARMTDGIPYDEALARYRAGANVPRPLPEGQPVPTELLRQFHPDYQDGAHTTLAIGPNRGGRCQTQVASLLQSNGLVDEIDLAGAPARDVDVLVER